MIQSLSYGTFPSYAFNTFYQAREFLKFTDKGDDTGVEDATLGTRYENIHHLSHQRNSKKRRYEGTP
jgi:hypothetical protein